MRRYVVLIMSAALALMGLQLAQPAQAIDSPGGQLASEVAASGTPHVLDGRVLAVTRVGDTIILGGTFSRARNDNSSTELSRSRLLAFNANTGQISAAFTPNPNGTVHSVIPAGDGETVYVGGHYTSIGGVARQRVSRIRVSDGAVISSFNAGGVSGQVRDLALKDGRLWVAGAFTHIGGRAQKALATLNPTTGAPLDYMSLLVDGFHNDGNTQVLKIDVTPDGSRLVAIGNLSSLEGVTNRQTFMLDLTGATAQPADFRTNFYSPRCSSSFDTYMRDVQFSPAGDFFVIVTTGAYGGSSSPCDTSARFETSSTGGNIVPSWIDYTGGDTTLSVEVTDSAVYVGGHFRWQNNAHAGDRIGPGAVSRPGLAALDPTNGMPYSWNPTRTLGVGVFDFHYSDHGLWVGSDTDRIGNWQYKGRIARMPITGVTFPTIRTPGLPNDLYTFGSGGIGTAPSGGIGRRAATTSSFGSLQTVDNGGINWNNIRGAFMINGWLYLAHSNGDLTRRTFDGSSYGPAVAVNTHDQLSTLTAWRNDVANATGMFYDSGRIYFTNATTNRLYYRYFTAENDVVGAVRYEASSGLPGLDFRTVRGMFTDGGSHLFWAGADGNLRRVGWVHEGPSGAPVPGTISTVSGPLVDGITWGARGLFLPQGEFVPEPPNQPPTASFTASCTELSCTFDGTGSTDPDGSIASHTWDFGDGTGDTGAQVQHTYANGGARTVTLTVVDDDGASDTTSRTVNPTEAGDPTVSFVAAASGNANATAHRVTVPSSVQAGDALVLTMAVNSTSVTVADPAGWTPLSSLDGNNVRGRAWTRSATTSDPGSVLQVSTSGTAKADLSVAAYRGSGGEMATVVAHEAALDQANGTDHVSPTVSLPGSNAWVSTYWASKSSSTVEWSLPSTLEQRTASSGGGGGQISAVVADTGAPAPSGTAGGDTAVSDPAVSRVVMFTTAIGLGGQEPPEEEPPPEDPEPPADDVVFVGADSGNANTTTHRVTLPTSVQTGDTLVLTMAVNSTSGTVGNPAGWTTLSSLDGANVRGRAWTRTATAGDVGAVVEVPTSGTVKADLSVAAYRGADGAATAVVDHQASLDQANGTDHVAPSVTVPDGGGWVARYWAAKSSSEVTWSTPPGQAQRAASAGAGGGRVTAVLVDSDGPIGSGPTGGMTGVSDPAVNRVVMFTTVVARTG